MRKLLHRILSMLLVALLLVSILPTAVFAATPLRNYWWNGRHYI